MDWIGRSFKAPDTWARRYFASNSHYLIMMVGTVLVGVAIIAGIILLKADPESFGWGLTVVLCIIFIVVAIEQPLLYLMALRKLVASPDAAAKGDQALDGGGKQQ